MASPRRTASKLQPLHDLRSATDHGAWLSALKRVKYDLSGHLCRKVDSIKNGLIPLLAEILANSTAQKSTAGAVNSTSEQEDEVLFTQVAQVLCVIAHEGPAFVQPILETDVLQSLVPYLLRPLPAKVSLSILKCLNAIADNLPPSSTDHWPQDGRLADLLYSKKYIQCLGNVVESAGDTVVSQQACDAALALMCKTVRHEHQKRALVESGLLTLLSGRLASFVVAEGLVPPGSEALDSDSALFLGFPDPAPSCAHLSPVLESLFVLTEQSKYRTALFLADSAVRTVLPDFKDDFSPSDIRRAPWGGSYFSGAAVPRSRLHGPFDSLLPVAPISDKSSSAAQTGFPPLSAVTAVPKRRASFLPTMTEIPQLAMGRDAADEVDESSVVSWLLYVARESRGKRRLLAAKLLVNLYSLGFVKRDRGSSFAPLLVPLLTRMLNQDPAQHDTFQQVRGPYLCSGLHYTKAVPAVLAELVMDDPEMQRVAVEGHAIRRLSSGLKATFDSPASRTPAPWQPQKTTEEAHAASGPGTRIGPGGPTWTMRREMDYREGCLQALAAIAPFEDDYRKEICDEGVLAHIMLALEPFHVQLGPGRQLELMGNSASVILAACGAVRMLTRSVKALRTKLIEAEVAKPIIRLMNSTNPEVRIAATRVLANLAIDFSPVKDSVGDTTVVKKLCEQAHSANARLRLESLWALKQLVLNASKKLKQDVVDELGTSWIKLLIKTDPVDIPEGEVIGLVEREYPPIMTYHGPSASNDNPNDVIMGDNSDGEQETSQPSWFERGGDESTTSDQYNGFETRHTTEEDTEIQAQLLDLLRNLFCGDNASDLVKYIFDEMGQDDFFRIMLDRLRPRTLAGATRKDNYTTSAPAAIVVKVLYVLVHVGACEPRWRNAIAAQQALMKQVSTFCSHADREIRAQCCWIVINLTYEDDASDRAACKHRATELHKAGFAAHLRRLENDSDLNVRERAKSAIHLMSKLIAS